jgi:alkanesulfonate monooxygenase SsuD/methylene tetrahydromethanopterin reductase-like flavin-dependent oxidoreductase (luciferase family)
MLSRTQPRNPNAPFVPLEAMQNPMLDAYLEALPADRVPRILASRTIFVVDDRKDAYRFAASGLPRLVAKRTAMGGPAPAGSVHDLIKAFDVHLGTPDEVIGSLAADSTLERATDLTMQVHSIDPPHPFILRSIELMAEKVAPALGWARTDAGHVRRVA